MKDRFDLTNLPLSFFDDFFDIERDEVKKAILNIVNFMYDDYSIEEVQEMFSTFTKTSYEIYELFLYNRDVENLDLLIEVMLYCSSQFESYKVYNPVKAFNDSRNHAKVVLPRRR